jgi:pimeloyl-ACP methyl ester carboxylesterase
VSSVEDRGIPGLGDTELHVRVAGVGGVATPVLLVHGLSSNARMWDGVAERLAAAGHPVAAVDQRGHGLSAKPSDGYDFATLTGDLLAVTDALGWTGERAPFAAGQSWGGNVVLELAARHPNATSGLALVDGGIIELAERFADWPTCEAALAPPQFDGITAESFERMLRAQHPHWPESGIQGALGNVEVLADTTIRPWLSRPNHMQILRGLWEHRPSARFASVKVPALILPAEDSTNPRWMASKRVDVERAAASLERSFTRWMTGDHDLHAEHPDLVAELIDAACGPGLFP